MNPPQFVFKEYGGLTAWQINWIFIGTCTLFLVLGNCGGLKGIHCTLCFRLLREVYNVDQLVTRYYIL